MTAPTVTLHIDRKCDECGKPDATSTGICLFCTCDAMSWQPMKSAAGRAVQAEWRAMREKHAGWPISVP